MKDFVEKGDEPRVMLQIASAQSFLEKEKKSI